MKSPKILVIIVIIVVASLPKLGHFNYFFAQYTVVVQATVLNETNY